MNAVSDSNLSPLQLMLTLDRIESLMELLCYGANCNIGDINGNTPLHIAAQVTLVICEVLCKNVISFILLSFHLLSSAPLRQACTIHTVSLCHSFVFVDGGFSQSSQKVFHIYFFCSLRSRITFSGQRDHKMS